MQFETIKRSRLPLLLAIPAGALALTGCSGPNYSGAGNEFVVHGKVTDPGKHSLKANIYRVDEANGDAEGWFKPNSNHQIHDNCDCDEGGWSVDNIKVGDVYGQNGNVIPPSEVAIGACVKFTGRIRANYEGKTQPERPVYEYAQEETCPPGQR